MKSFGILIMSHGSRSGEWVRLVDEAVSRVRLPEGVPVVSSFLEIVEGRLLQDGIRVLEGQGVTDIVAVPLFVSSGSTHIDEISYALGVIPRPALQTKLVPLTIRAKIHMTNPIDDDPDIARIVYDHVKELSRQPDKEALLLVGHGSAAEGFHQRWRKGLERLALRIKELGGFDEAEAAMLLPDQVSSTMKRLLERKPDHDVVVAPLFLSKGYFTSQVIPTRLEGYAYRYNGRPLLPHPLISVWMEKQIDAVLAAFGFESTLAERVIKGWSNVQD